MLEIKVTVHCPDLVLATTALAKLFKPSTPGPIFDPVDPPYPAVRTPEPAGTWEPGGGEAVETPALHTTCRVPDSVAAPIIPAPAVPAPVATPAPVPVAPATPAVPVAPVATAAPTYTLETIATAGTALIDSGKMNELLGLLAKYGVDALTALDPAQYGAFATDLRAIGAMI